MNRSDPNLEHVLVSANRRLSETLHRPMLDLTTGGERSLSDNLWVWGILGGKNVGKSTLIDALAGGEIVDHGQDAGEGTFRPAAYLNAADVEALRARFAELGSMPITFHTDAPDGARGLVLVDLPDFDSLFTSHVDQVRRIAGVLDGVIWVTTPKKVGDLRAIQEIHRVLKDRTNFVHVVNKMDWLLAQTDAPPLRALDRVVSALDAQITAGVDRQDATPTSGPLPLSHRPAAAQPSDGRGRTDQVDSPSGRLPEQRTLAARRAFLISAKYRTSRDILDSIARGRDAARRAAAAAGDRHDANGSLREAAERLAGDRHDANGSLREAAERLAGDFESLRCTLTTTPTPEAAAANKRANLNYQARIQAIRLLNHYQPRLLIDRLDSIMAAQVIGGAIERAFPPVYGAHVMQRLNGGAGAAGLFVQWSIAMFKERIAHWTLLGIIAWPVALVGLALGGLRSVLAGTGAPRGDDPFRFDGLTLEERIEAALAAIEAALAGVTRRIDIELPSCGVLAQQFRADVRSLTDELRSAVIDPYRLRNPGPAGRLLRWALPLAVLLWFPLVQPLLEGLIPAIRHGGVLNADVLYAMVRTLSASHVLTGFAVALLILGILTAAVYSGAVRDSFAALDRLGTASVDTLATDAPGPTSSLVHAVSKPIEAVRSELTAITEPLERLAGKA